MALSAAQQWWVRPGGNVLNGGGFDSTVTSPGTNYSDQDSAQVTFNGSTVTAVTSGTSATITITGYTVAAADVGNICRIASGTNFTAGYYCITSVNVGANSWTFDRNCTSGVGAAMVGRMGGAHADIVASYGNDPAPTLTSPVVAGNTINVRGSGNGDPASADYTYTSGFKGFAFGTTTAPVTIQGYNGRPCFGVADTNFYANGTFVVRWKSIKFLSTAASSTGILYSANAGSYVSDCIFDQAGFDVYAVRGLLIVYRCTFKNTGSTSAGSQPAINSAGYGTVVAYCTFTKWRGYAIQASQAPIIHDCVIDSCKDTSNGSIRVTSNDLSVSGSIKNNTIYGGAKAGIQITTTTGIMNTEIVNNTITNCGGYGIDAASGSDAVKALCDYNNFGTGATANTSGALNNLTAGPHDLAVDPQFADAANGDFTVGTNLKAVGIPALLGAL